MPLSGRDYDELRGLFGLGPLPQVSGQLAIAETIPRKLVSNNAVAIATSGAMILVAIYIPQGVPVTNISVVGGGTAEASGSHMWMALYTTDYTAGVTVAGRLLAQTTDDTGAAAIAANTVVTKALTAPQIAPYSGLYYLALSVTATTMPTVAGITVTTNAGFQGLLPILAVTSGASLAGTAPATVGIPTSVANIPYLFVS